MITAPLVAGVVALVGPLGAPAAAHDGNVGVSEITIDDAHIEYELYLDQRFLTAALPDLRLDGGTLTEPQARRLLADGLEVSVGARPVAAGPVTVGTSSTGRLGHLGGVAMMGDIPLVRITAGYDAAGPAVDYRLVYRLFLPDKGQQPHSNLAWIHAGGGTRTFIFAPGGPALTPGAGQAVAPPAAARPSGRGVPAAPVAGFVALLATIVAAVAWLVRIGRARGSRPPGRR